MPAFLQQSGLDLVLKNFQGYLNNIGKINRSYQTMAKEADKASKSVKKAGDIAYAANKRAQNAADNVARAQINYEQAQDRVVRALAKVNTATKNQAAAAAQLTVANQNEEKALLALNIAQRNEEMAKRRAADATDAYNALSQRSVNISQVAAMAVRGLGAALNVLGIALGVVKGAFSIIGGAINGVVGLFNKFKNAINSILSPFKEFIKSALSVATGFVIFDLFRNATNSIRDMTSQLIEALSYFQMLNIQLETLAARDISQAMGIDVAKAFDLVGNRAQVLLDWIRQLAVTTPFSARGIAETLAMANAMGLTITQAKQLTVAVGNFTAAMGLGEDHMYRIIYNFGQMLSQGKLTQRDFRDLANSMVPVWDILDRMAAQAGMTTQEFKKIALEGGVPVEAFFNEFIYMANHDFPGAMQKMSRTMTGVMNNIKDFIETVIGIDVFGPVFNRFTEKAAGALDKLLTPAVRQAAKYIGEVLLRAAQTVTPAIETLLQSVANLVQAFGIGTPTVKSFSQAIANLAVFVRKGIEAISGFINQITVRVKAGMENVAKNAQSWGYNIVAAIANGMALAIRLITTVINAISRILAYWLQAHSPPKIAPNLEKWGAAAMASWLEGWTKADFSIFNEIADKIESYIRSITSKIGEINVVPLILKMRESIAKAIDAVRGGAMSIGEAINYVMSRARVLPASFRDYIRALFQVELAQKAVADAQMKVADAQAYEEIVAGRLKVAQGELNAVQDKYSEILDELNKQLDQVTEQFDEQHRLQEINAAIATGLLTTEERQRLEAEKRAIEIKQQIRNTEDQRDAEMGVIQARIAALEAQQEAAQAMVDLAQKQLDAAEAQQQAAQDQLDAAQALIDAQIKNNQLIEEQLALIKSIQEAAGQAGQDLSDLWGNLADTSAGIADNINRQFREADEASMQAYNVWKQFQDAETSIQNMLDNVIAMGGVFDPITTAVGGLTAAFDSLSTTATPILESLGLKAGGAGIAPNSPLAQLGGALSTIGESLGKFDWKGFVDGIVLLAQKIADTDWNEVATNISEIIDALSSVDWVQVATSIADTVTSISNFLTTVNDAGNKFGEFMDKIGASPDKWSLLDVSVDTTDSGLWNFVNNTLIPIGDKVGTWAVTVAGWFQWLSDTLVGKSIVPDMMQDIYDAIMDKLGEILDDVWKKLWNDFLTFVTDIWNDPDGIVQKVIGGVNDLTTAIRDNLTKVITDFKTNALDPLYGAFKDVRDITSSLWSWIGKLALAIATLDLTKILDLLGIGGRGGATGGTGTGATTGETGKPWKQEGGFVQALGKYIVGEKGPEMFIPSMSGYVLPNWLTERIMAPAVSTVQYIDQSVHLEVNPSYKNVQSEASIYYDVTAALAAVRR